MEYRPLHLQLESLRCLVPADLEVLDELLGHEHTYDRGQQLLLEDSEFKSVMVIMDGWAMRYKTLPDGRRQILNYLLPGDIVGFFSLLFETAEYGVETLTPVTVNATSPVNLLEAFRNAPRLAIALSWLAGQNERQLDEQIMRIGRRGAAERMAHLFLELRRRLLNNSMDREAACIFPLTQATLADTLGMSHVHANRSFRKLVRDGLVRLHDSHIELLDIANLAKIADFDASYLEQDPLPPTTRNALSV